MDKIAQKRSVLNKLREMTNVSGIAAEKFFNPQFQEVMDNLRSVDANIRSMVIGKSVDDGDPGNNAVALKDLLKSVKSNFNRREYMSAVAELSQFHSKVANILSEIKKLETKVDEVHHQFLFQDLGDDHKKELEGLKSKWSSIEENSFLKEADIKDFLHNILTDRGRALGFYEKRYPKQVAILKRDTSKLLDRSEALLGLIISSLKEMAAARAVRNPDKYMASANKIEKGYRAYDVMFKEFYNTNVKEFLNKVPQVPTQKIDEKGLGQQEIPGTTNAPDTQPNLPSFPLSPSSNPPPPSGEVPIDLVNPKLPSPPNLPTNVGLSEDDEEPPTLRNPPVTPTVPGVAPPANPPNKNTIPYDDKVLAHSKFWESLESLANEDHKIISSYIRKYAQSIQATDPITAIKLLQISKSIKD